MDKAKYIAIAAITMDGKIAKSKHHMSDWTSPEDKVFMRALLDKCDVIIVGNNTYKTAIKPLSKRNCIVFSRSLPPSSPSGRGQGEGVFKKSDTLLYCNPSIVDVKRLIAKLPSFAQGFGGLAAKNNKRWPKKIAILGGAQTYAYCLKNNLLDELYLTIEPLVFGKGINLFADDSLEKQFKFISTKKLNAKGSLLIHYKHSG